MVTALALVALYTGPTVNWSQSKAGLYTISGKLPDVRGTKPGNAVWAAMMKDLNAQAAQIKTGAASAQKGGNLRYPYGLTVTPVASSSSRWLANVVVGVSPDTNGAHPGFFYWSATYAMIQGPLRRLQITDLFAPGTDVGAQLTYPIFEKLRKGDQAMWVQDGTVREVKTEDLQNFSLSPRGVTFYFDPYLYGPWASGPIQVTLTPTQLGPNFKRGFLGK